MIHPSEEVSLLNALDMVVFERIIDGSLLLTGRPPAWFERVCALVPGRQYRHELAAQMPFIETLLLDAEDLWASPRGAHYAGHWVQSDMDGFERNIEAWAVNAGARRFLLLRLLGPEFDEARRVLQQLRTSKLADELKVTHKHPWARLSALGQSWFVRGCLGVCSLVSLALFVLKGFSLGGFHLDNSLMNWIGLAGLASIIGLIVGSERSRTDS